MMYRNPAVALMPDITPKPLRSKANGIINIMGYIGGAFATVVGLVFVLSEYLGTAVAKEIALELVTIFSFIVIGVTILTFMYYDVEMSRSYLGSLVLAIGVTELVSFLSLRDLAKLRNIPNAVAALNRVCCL